MVCSNLLRHAMFIDSRSDLTIREWTAFHTCWGGEFEWHQDRALNMASYVCKYGRFLSIVHERVLWAI